MTPISRKDLEDKGFDVTGEGASLVATRREGRHEAQDRMRSKPKKGKEPLPQSIIDALVEGMPAPEKPWNAKVPTVFGIDPSVVNAGIAELGYNTGVLTSTIKPNPADDMGDRLFQLASGIWSFMDQSAGPGYPDADVIVEGHYWQSSGDASASSIQTYCEAVGTAFGTAYGLCSGTVKRVATHWAPDILMGRIKGGTTKVDRHAVAKRLLARVGVEWPEGITEHEQDALCFCVAHLVEGGWL